MNVSPVVRLIQAKAALFENLDHAARAWIKPQSMRMLRRADHRRIAAEKYVRAGWIELQSPRFLEPPSGEVVLHIPFADIIASCGVQVPRLASCQGHIAVIRIHLLELAVHGQV